MFERFTEAARKAVFYARFEASELGGKSITTEHLLLGALRSEPELATLLLPGLDREAIRDRIEAASPKGPRVPASVDMPLSEAAKRALAYGAEDAGRMGERIIRPAHLLMGILREAECLASDILLDHGVTAQRLREAAIAAAVPALAAEAPPGHPPRPAGEVYASAGASVGAAVLRVRDLLRFQPRTREVVFRAWEEAADSSIPAVDPFHLLFALLAEDQELAQRFFGSPEAANSLRGRIARDLRFPAPAPPDDVLVTADSQQALQRAVREAEELGQTRADNAHLLLALLRAPSGLLEMLVPERPAYTDVRRALSGGA